MTYSASNRVRKASLADIPSIRAIADVTFRATYADILSPEQLEFMMDWMYSEESLRCQIAEDGHIFFLEEGRGYVSFHYDKRDDDGVDVYHLEKLYVLPEFQKSGLGRFFFKLVCQEAVEDSASATGVRIELNVNRNNPEVGFYERLGMYRRRTGDFPIGHGYYMNDYIMALDIPAK